MISDDFGDITPLLTSRPTEVINKRFIVKGSIFNTGNDKPQILILVYDVVELAFKMRYFIDTNEASSFINILREIK